jgi:MoxR-like ATPase
VTLATLGVYGFDRYEHAILASLVTEDPLLLIGRSGTGKTYLLNSLSEALGLEHRHYNASLISFDDLVGFPYPDDEKREVKFLETPATVWNAESVLVDEISRCKPEHQNRLFSLVHERRVQGLPLTRLRYRWAAMNPCSVDQGDEQYAGSEALDPALADRFALVVPAADWLQIDEQDRARIANPAGEGKIADDGGVLRGKIAAGRAEFLRRIDRCPRTLVDYATAAVTTLNQKPLRVSPRRARLLTRSLLAAEIVAGGRSEELYLSILECALPHPAWGVTIDPPVVRAAHRLAWDYAFSDPRRQWIQRFLLAPALDAKLKLLVRECPDPEIGTQAVNELLAAETPARAAAFALALYPAAIAGLPFLGREGVNDLGRIAVPVLRVDGTLHWREPLSGGPTTHPELARFSRAVNATRGARRERARQLLYHCAVARLDVDDPEALEREFHACVTVMKRYLKRVGAEGE